MAWTIYYMFTGKHLPISGGQAFWLDVALGVLLGAIAGLAVWLSGTGGTGATLWLEDNDVEGLPDKTAGDSTEVHDYGNEADHPEGGRG